MLTKGREWDRDPRFSGETLRLFAGENPGFPARNEVFRLWVTKEERQTVDIWEREREREREGLRKPKKR
jgi:hypothetical protein